VVLFETGDVMATIDECRAALGAFATRMSGGNTDVRERPALDRTLACRITDLGVGFHGRFVDGQILDLADGDDPAAKIRMIAASSDLIAVVNGALPLASAWSSGIIKIEASVFDLVKLRKLL
jgi:hypothetical protein